MRSTHRSARTSPPRLSHVVPRARLFRTLDRLRASPIVWIRAPAGSGKTALVASWLVARRLRAMWLELRPGDDPAAVFGHLRGAARGLLGPRADLPAFRPENLAAPDAYARRFFRALAVARRHPAVLVLDDYHALDPGSLVHGMLRDGIAEVEGGPTLVVASRGDPPAAWARLRAAGALATVEASALALTPAESRALARLRAPRSPPPDSVLAIAKGWVAGVVLLAVAGGEGPDPERARRGGVFDYLAVEVFDRLDPRTRDVLLRTSVLMVVDEGAAVRLSGQRDAGERLAELARLGSFTDRLAGATAVYRYHELFRAFLLARARALLGAPAVADLARAAAALLLERGEGAAALEILAAHEAWDELARVLFRQAPALLAAGRSEALLRWIDLLPPEHAAGQTWLRYWRGVARFPHDPPLAAEEVAEAHAAFVAGGDAAGAYLSWASAADMTIWSLHDLAPLDRWLDALGTLRARFPAFPGAEVESAVVASVLGAYTNRRPADPQLPEWEERALAIALAPGDVRLRLGAGRHLLLRRAYWGGDVVGARVLVEALRPLATQEGAPLTDALLWYLVEAAFHDHTGRGRVARQVAERGLDLAARTGVHAFDAPLHAQKVFAALTDEDFVAAERDLGALAKYTESAPRLNVLAWHHLAATVALRRGDVRDALQRARIAAGIAVEAGHPVLLAASHVVWAAAAARGGGSGPTLEEAALRSRRDGFGYGAMMAPLVQASVLLAAGDEDGAAARLAEVLPLLRRAGCMNAYWLGRADLAELCALALERDLESEFTLQIVLARGLRAGPRGRLLWKWPWPVRIEALGGLRVVAAGREWPNGRRTPRKPLQLLKLLVAHGDGGARPEALADALWPDAEGDAARHALETTAYRLRGILGAPEALALHGDRLALDPGCVFVDAWALEAMAARAQGLRARGEHDAACRLAATAVRLDVGQLFGDDRDELVTFARERLRKRMGALRAGEPRRDD